MSSMSASRVAGSAPDGELGSFSDGRSDFLVVKSSEATLHVYCGPVLALVLRGVGPSAAPYAVSWSSPWRSYSRQWQRRFVFETLMVFLRREASRIARELVAPQ